MLTNLEQWIIIPRKLVYLALHFTIGKCKCTKTIEKQITHALPAILGYSNSLLATYVLYW
jgi:hypothetical protein